MPTTIDQLNDDCLALVLNQCSLQELLLKERAVSVRWCTLVDGLLRIKKSLTIFGSAEDCREYSGLSVARHQHQAFNIRDSLILSELKHFEVAQLPFLMPNVQRLVLCCSTSQYGLDLAALLSLWPHFTTLTVVRCPVNFIRQRNFRVVPNWHKFPAMHCLQLLKQYAISPKVFYQLESLGIHWTIELL